MGTASRYWTLMRINAGGRCQAEVLAAAKHYFEQEFPQARERVTDSQVQSHLYGKLQDRTSDSAAELCLRCFISNITEQVCVDLVNQFGKQHGFTRFDLYPYVLDEWNPMRRHRRADNGRQYRSLSQEVLQTYDPKQGTTLATWTSRLVRRHRELNSYLLECGVYLVSDWAILNDTTQQQVRRIFTEFYALTPVETDRACWLLETYHGVYRRDRLRQRQAGTAGRRCYPPTTEQVREMAQRYATSDRIGSLQTIEPAEVTPRLQGLAERLRQYRIYIRGGSGPTEMLHSETGQLSVPVQQSIKQQAEFDSLPDASESQTEQAEFLAYYREQFPICISCAVERVMDVRIARLQRKSQQKARQFMQALTLFHCQGQSMGNIAPQVGLKAQYQVSRLLKLKELRADVRRQTLLELRDRVIAKASQYVSSTAAQVMERQIDSVLGEQIDAVFKEAEAEASVSHNRPPSSLYTRSLCRYLTSRIAS